jgi:hypothetical protein
MKKRVEAELISIAHRILKLKNKSEIDQLYKETQKLYEALTILKFYGENYEMVKDSLPIEEIEEKVASFIEQTDDTTSEKVENQKQEEVITEDVTTLPEEVEKEKVVVGEIVIEEEDEKEEVENLVEESSKEDSFMPSFELSFEEEKESLDENATESENTPPSKQVTMDDVFADHFQEPVFVKPEENVQGKFVNVFEEKEKTSEESGRVLSLNDTLSNSISIGLNDRIGFVKHLFNDSNEDYNRVLSQLNTFDTFEEAKTFLNEMVIPDYNYWVGKEEYLERFMEIIEKKFK